MIDLLKKISRNGGVYETVKGDVYDIEKAVSSSPYTQPAKKQRRGHGMPPLPDTKLSTRAGLRKTSGGNLLTYLRRPAGDWMVGFWHETEARAMRDFLNQRYPINPEPVAQGILDLAA